MYSSSSRRTMAPGLNVALAADGVSHGAMTSFVDDPSESQVPLPTLKRYLYSILVLAQTRHVTVPQ